MGKGHLWTPAIYEVHLCISFTHGGGLYNSCCVLCAKMYSAFLAKEKREVAEGVKNWSPCGFLEEVSLTTLKTDDGSIRLLWQPFAISGYLWYEEGELDHQKNIARQCAASPLLMYFYNEASKIRTWLKAKADSCFFPLGQKQLPKLWFVHGTISSGSIFSWSWATACCFIKFCGRPL